MKKAIEVWNQVRGPLLRLVFLQVMLFLGITGLNTFHPPLPLFMVICISVGYVYGKALIPWVWEEHDKKGAEMLKETRERVHALQQMMLAREQANMQEMLQTVMQLNPKKKPEAPN